MPDASVPSVLTATYGQWAIASLRIVGDGLVGLGQPGPPPPVAIEATLVKFRIRDDGVPERSPLPGDTVQVLVPDIYALAATDEIVGPATMGFVGAVFYIAGQQGDL